MKQEQSKKQIIEVIRSWKNKNELCGDHFGIELYGWLQKNRPELLKFRFSGDKYQLINTWVVEWQKSNCPK